MLDGVPFVCRSKMDERRRLCLRVLGEGWSVARASREAGVSRQTGSLWVGRARADGLEKLSERSRRPLSSPLRTSAQIEARLVELAQANPYWGPRKILAHGYGSNPPVCERTAARILSRHGHRVNAPPGPDRALIRFERDTPNELWQMDFKLLGPRRERVQLLSVLDDATRFLLRLESCPDQTLESVWEVLWDAFDEYGLPAAILTDNGPAFRCNATWRWSVLDLQLMLLGVRSLHSRPYHPQTQGKVERFHGTLERERVHPRDAEAFRTRYNWVRPHEAVGMNPPGLLYAPSPRTRPATMPRPWFLPDAEIRKTDALGKFSYQGKRYRAGIAFQHASVGIVSTPDGPCLSWAGQILSPLEDLEI